MKPGLQIAAGVETAVADPARSLIASGGSTGVSVGMRKGVDNSQTFCKNLIEKGESDETND
jgi:hypothetical protein